MWFGNTVWDFKISSRQFSSLVDGRWKRTSDATLFHSYYKTWAREFLPNSSLYLPPNKKERNQPNNEVILFLETPTPPLRHLVWTVLTHICGKVSSDIDEERERDDCYELQEEFRKKEKNREFCKRKKKDIQEDSEAGNVHGDRISMKVTPTNSAIFHFFMSSGHFWNFFAERRKHNLTYVCECIYMEEIKAGFQTTWCLVIYRIWDEENVDNTRCIISNEMSFHPPLLIPSPPYVHKTKTK